MFLMKALLLTKTAFIKDIGKIVKYYSNSKQLRICVKGGLFL